MSGSRRRTTQRPPATSRFFFSAIVAFSALTVVAACGKKGPPLPPLVKLPQPPGNFTADRRGGTVDLQFDVPSANTDNTRPANVAHVDVYAITASEALTDEQILKQGTRVASVDVKAPKNPDETVEEDEPDVDMEAPQGKGLDQGAVAHVSETLAPSAFAPVPPDAKKKKAEPAAPAETPLLPARLAPLLRTYVAVGVSARGGNGPVAKRTIPLVPPPPSPGSLDVTYDEKAITVQWTAVAARSGIQRAPQEGELPSRPIGAVPASVDYNVYDAKTNARLTQAPVDALTFSDSRLVWGEERCYTVRALETIGDQKIESEAPPPVCTTPVDTFPPAAPANLQSSPSAGAISLIWDRNAESDLAGYIVLRGDSVATLRPMSSDVIQETTFRDEVQPGIRFTYAVVAVDRAGNRSPASKPVEETARE